MRSSGSSLVAASFVLALAAAVTTGLGAYWNSRMTADAMRWVSRTYQVAAELENVLSLLKDAETGQRGFLLTANPEYLEPYRLAQRTLPDGLQVLQQLTADNPDQQQRVRRLRELADQKLELSTQSVLLMDAEGFERGLEIVRSGRGKKAMDDARQQVALMKEEEDRLLSQRLQQVDAAQQRSGATAALTSAILLVLITTVFAASRRATERTQAALDTSEAERREAEFIRSALDRAAIVSVADADGRLLNVNDSFVQASGYGREELVGQDFGVVASELPPDFQTELRAGRTWRGETRNTARDGHAFWTDTTVVPLLDQSGRPERYIAIHHDITDRKQAQQATLRTQALVYDIVDGARALIFAKDLQGRYFLTNRAWQSLTGLSREQADGVGDAEVFGDEAAARLARADRHVMETGEPVLVEESAEVGGRTVCYLSSKFPLRDEAGKVYAVCGVSTDITELRIARDEVQRLNADLEQRVRDRTRQLSEANEQLEAFSYTVSHDLRAPLRGLQGFAQAVHEDYGDQLDATGRDYLDRIMAAARRMEALIQDLLEYGRLSRDQLQLRDVNLALTVQDVLAQLEPEMRERQAEVKVDGTLPLVRAHPTVLMQVVGNLVGNAVKFVEPALSPRLRIWAETTGDRVRTFVQDNGLGVRPEHQERIFGVFERLHGQEAFPGSGVGLAIVRKGTERMGGSCGVRSAAGEGSTFWFELQAAQEAPA